MTDVDFLILAFVGLSAVLSFFRGIFREALSLGVWLCALLLTLAYASRFATLLPIDSVQSPLARANISGVILFIGTLFIGGIVKWFVASLLVGSTLRIIDRVGGVAFGLLRGVLIVALMVLGANLAPELKREQWWQESVLIPRLQAIASTIHVRLPESVGQHFDFTSNGY